MGEYEVESGEISETKSYAQIVRAYSDFEVGVFVSSKAPSFGGDSSTDSDDSGLPSTRIYVGLMKNSSKIGYGVCFEVKGNQTTITEGIKGVCEFTDFSVKFNPRRQDNRDYSRKFFNHRIYNNFSNTMIIRYRESDLLFT